MRGGLRGLIELGGQMTVVGEAGDGRSAIAMIRDVRPDVVLLDVRMPHGDGPAVLRALDPVPPTILLTTFDDDEALLAGLKAGARAFLLKDVSLDQLLDAIRRVAVGETLIRPGVSERIRRRLDGVAPTFERALLPDRLTRREIEVLRLMAGGFANREIASALGTSEGTVKNHASAILHKLGVRDRTRAVLLGLQRGLI
jgi:DNA-binding NarL/FixJ family response regulator